MKDLPPSLDLSRKEALAPRLRWSPGRKAQILRAIARGTVTPEEVMSAHVISADELDSWQRAASQGVGALRVTRRNAEGRA